MAASGDGGNRNKTEPPTPKRLRDARRDGDVARSPDLIGFAGTLTGVVVIAVAGGWMMTRLRALLQRAVEADLRSLETQAALLDWVGLMMREVLLLSLPVALAVAAVAALAGGIHVGGVFSLKAIAPKLSRLSPTAGIKRMFSVRTLIELVKAIVKCAVLGLAVWLLCKSLIPVLYTARYLPPAGILPIAADLLGRLAWTAAGVYGLFALFDVWYQRIDYLRRLRMSKDEVRREHKEMEGDPHIRGMRRQLQQEMSMQAMLDNVRQASVVVVNPTHIAVALFYEEDRTDLPVVVAKGEGEVARAIREAAEEAGVPILRDVQLARRLNEKAPLDQFIPTEFIEPVAAVLRWARGFSI